MWESDAYDISWLYKTQQMQFGFHLWDGMICKEFRDGQNIMRVMWTVEGHTVIYINRYRVFQTVIDVYAHARIQKLPAELFKIFTSRINLTIYLYKMTCFCDSKHLKLFITFLIVVSLILIIYCFCHSSIERTVFFY